jgi:hypothetical protein
MLHLARQSSRRVVSPPSAIKTPPDLFLFKIFFFCFFVIVICRQGVSLLHQKRLFTNSAPARLAAFNGSSSSSSSTSAVSSGLPLKIFGGFLVAGAVRPHSFRFFSSSLLTFLFILLMLGLWTLGVESLQENPWQRQTSWCCFVLFCLVLS